MSDSYKVETVVSLLTGTATDRTKTITADDTCTEDFWATVQLEAAAADVVLLLNLETDPKILVVAGGKGVTFKLGNAGGTDSIGADPLAVVGDENGGLGITGIQLSNSDTVSHSVTVVAME